MNNKVKGYLLGAVAAASYGTNPLFAYHPHPPATNKHRASTHSECHAPHNNTLCSVYPQRQ